jgi:hypothetical protein
MHGRPDPNTQNFPFGAPSPTCLPIATRVHIGGSVRSHPDLMVMFRDDLAVTGKPI